MRTLFFLILLLIGNTCVAKDKEFTYQGKWKTVSGKILDGTMNCIVTPVANEKWKGRFWGTWQGVDFDYTVDFTGPPEKLIGKAKIDGASYDWKGEMAAESPGRFKGSFTGSRYDGSFDLKGQKPKK